MSVGTMQMCNIYKVSIFVAIIESRSTNLFLSGEKTELTPGKTITQNIYLNVSKIGLDVVVAFAIS
jgi:hypothetical protein